MAKNKYQPTKKAKKNPRSYPIFKDGKQIGVCCIGSDTMKTRVTAPKIPVLIKPATQKQLEEIHVRTKGKTKLVELVTGGTDGDDSSDK